MVNIREISVGSIVRVNLGRYGLLTCQVAEITATRIGVIVLEKILVTDLTRRFLIGKIHRFKHFRFEGVNADDMTLRHLGFVPADRKGWQLMYYYGDMKLLYRYDKTHHRGSFRYMSEYARTYVRLSCFYIHQLQNIMRFLTEDLEFEYQQEISDNGTQK